MVDATTSVKMEDFVGFRYMTYGFESCPDYNMTFTENLTPEQAIRFAEFLGKHYVRLHAVWVHKYADVTQQTSWRTTETLLEYWLNNENFLKHEENSGTLHSV